MKRLTALLLILATLLCGCGGNAPEPTTEATTAPTTVSTEPTTEPTEAPTEPAPTYVNPLNGDISDTPYTGRIFATTISNVPAALPHVNVTEADILMEMFVNSSVVRCLALFSDISQVGPIGSTRSTRPMFNDIAEHYNAVLSHAGGTNTALVNANERGITHYNVDSLYRKVDEPLKANTAYRDKQYKYGEHNLFLLGHGIAAYAESEGIQLTGLPERDYGMTFAQDGTPVNGEPATSITLQMKYESTKKETVMEYDAARGKYVYWQYGEMMVDQITNEPETFENVVMMFVPMTTMKHGYHVADFLQGGTGYYACNGMIVPITWTCDGDKEPFRFLTAEGDPIPFGAGNTYIAISSPAGTVEWTAPEPEVPETTEATVPETTAETVAETIEATVPATTAS